MVRVLPRVYALKELPPWPSALVREDQPDPALLQHVAATLLALGPRSCARGRTAAALRGWSMLVEPDVIEAQVPHGSSRRSVRRSAVRRRRRHLPEHLLTGVRVTGVLDTLVEVCRDRPLLEAVVVLDSAFRARAVCVEEVRRAAGLLRGPSRRRLLRALAHADPLSGSPLESVLRVHLLRAGVRGWQTQVVLRDAQGRHILRADFCFPAARLVVEVDGRRWHQDATKDRGVDNRLAAAGWRVLRFTWSQVVNDPEAVLVLLRGALACDALHPVA